MSTTTKQVTVSTKGHLIDIHCKHSGGKLIESNGIVLDCILNQTEIGSNKNKFYIMQCIKTGSGYDIFIRYGRIGEVGRIEYKSFSSEASAVGFFIKQFRSKTGNKWGEPFEKIDGKYHLSEIQYDDIPSEAESESESEEESKLDHRVVNFIKLISNIDYMKNTLIELEIDTEKMPLGKISQGQIDKAYEVINQINSALDGSINSDEESDLVKLSSAFYTLIPYACGRNKPPIIDNKKMIGKYVNLLNELSQMVIGTRVVTKMKKDKTTIDKLYQDLKTEIIPLDKTDDMYKVLVEYLNNSKAPTHYFTFKVQDIFQIEREFEREVYNVYSKKLKNKTLLFHGTRVSNMIGILTNGLVVDPSKLGINVNITGKMFGMGLYFANSCSKSIQYCAYDTSERTALLFVSEVALGKMLERGSADCHLSARTLPKGYHSTWGLGKSGFVEHDEYDDGTRIPAGKLAFYPNQFGRSLLYDEFVVYREEQIFLRYIIRLKIE